MGGSKGLYNVNVGVETKGQALRATGAESSAPPWEVTGLEISLMADATDAKEMEEGLVGAALSVGAAAAGVVVEVVSSETFSVEVGLVMVTMTASESDSSSMVTPYMSAHAPASRN